MLNILEAYDLKALGFNSDAYLHVMTEAKKLAYLDRAKFYADPDFYKAPLDRLLSKEYAAELRRRINPDRALPDMPDPAVLNHGCVFVLFFFPLATSDIFLCFI
jgi:gamma-glutamyltranspeptidase/glutathione hydrolase